MRLGLAGQLEHALELTHLKQRRAQVQAQIDGTL